MAVIAKMNVSDVKEFPEGIHKFFLSTVCENGLMAHYNPENEDAVFTKYSPCGSCEITVGPGLEKPEKGSQVYVMFHEAHGNPSFEGACFAKLARVGYVTDYGQSKQVALGTAAPLWSQEENRLIDLPIDLIPEDRAVGGRDFELKLTIDNPHASVQFVPQGLYLVSFYDAAKLTMDEVLRLARA